MKLKILSVKNKPFKTDEGDDMDYFWYRAIRESDGVTIQFGSKTGEHAVGQTLDLNIEKTERTGGKFGYKEIAE